MARWLRIKSRKLLTDVVTCDYIVAMKEKRTTKWPSSKEAAAPLMLKEAAAMPGVGLVIPLRAAKAKLSALLEMVAQGHQVTITSDGVPKATLAPRRKRQPGGQAVHRNGGVSALSANARRAARRGSGPRGSGFARLVSMYLDTAIIVKLLVREPDSDWFNTALLGQHLDTSELALAEVRSALLAKERAGQITLQERVRASEKFGAMTDEDLVRLLPLNRLVLDRAVAIQLACHPRIPLRTLDALHVATCDLHRCGVLSTTDGRMRAACQQLAIALLPGRLEDVTHPGS